MDLVTLAGSSPAPALAAKADLLAERLRAAAPLLIAYSGGVDSAYLSFAARQALASVWDGEAPPLLAIIADSPSLPRAALAAAQTFAARHDIPCRVLATSELDNPAYRANDGQRCYHCKNELFVRMRDELAARPGFRALAYGLNADDPVESRPGHRAALEQGVLAPLREAGLGKADIRALARGAGLDVWDRPAAPCLSSRLARGLEVTPTRLAQVEAAEIAVAKLGFREFRVRHHGALARIEIAAAEMEGALEPAMAARLAAAVRPLGFTWVTLDLEGYRSGSLNEGQ